MRALDNILSTPTDQSTGPHPISLPHTIIEAMEKVKHLLLFTRIQMNFRLYFVEV
jgi:hypothetical protein